MNGGPHPGSVLVLQAVPNEPGMYTIQWVRPEAAGQASIDSDTVQVDVPGMFGPGLIFLRQLAAGPLRMLRVAGNEFHAVILDPAIGSYDMQIAVDDDDDEEEMPQAVNVFDNSDHNIEIRVRFVNSQAPQ